MGGGDGARQVDGRMKSDRTGNRPELEIGRRRNRNRRIGRIEIARIGKASVMWAVSSVMC